MTGTCDTEYTTADTDHNGHVLTKTKNLGGCLGRHGYRTSIQSVPYGNPDVRLSGRLDILNIILCFQHYTTAT